MLMELQFLQNNARVYISTYDCGKVERTNGCGRNVACRVIVGGTVYTV